MRVIAQTAGARRAAACPTGIYYYVSKVNRLRAVATAPARTRSRVYSSGISVSNFICKFAVAIVFLVPQNLSGLLPCLKLFGLSRCQSYHVYVLCGVILSFRESKVRFVYLYTCCIHTSLS